MTRKATTGDILIRRAARRDADVISRVLRRSFAGYEPLYTAKAFQATALLPAQVLERMREGPVWVALRGDAPVGTASALVTATGCYIRGTGVLPAARGQRIGWMLLDRIEQSARAERLPRLYLSTTPFLDRAISLYEHYGFRRIDGGPSELFGTPLFTMEKTLTAAGPEGQGNAHNETFS